METKGIVKEKSGNSVVVSVIREGACGGNCSSCGGCGSTVVKVRAENTAGADIGDEVVLESDSKAVFFAAFVTYILPVIVFFAVFSVLSFLGFGYKVIGLCEFTAVILYIFLLKKGIIGKKINVYAVKIVEKETGL